MPLDPFYLKTNQEIKKMIDNWFNNLEYLVKIRVMLRAYPKLNITKIEFQGIGILWKKIPPEEKKNIYQDNWKY